MVSMPILLKSYLWHLDSTVTGSLCTSVVARINITYCGGSSRVFKSALNAPVESICTSSIINTLYFPKVGGYCTCSFISLILSTPLLEAASISTTFMEASLSIDLQVGHSLHGPASVGFSQLSALAIILAILVFPVPLVPQKRYACDILPVFN